MADTLTADTETGPPPTPSGAQAFIDCDLHNELDSIRDLYPYLPRHWRDHIDTYGTGGPNAGWYPRFLDHREESRPPSGRTAGSEVAFTRTDFIEPHHVAYGILNPLGPAGGSSITSWAPRWPRRPTTGRWRSGSIPNRGCGRRSRWRRRTRSGRPRRSAAAPPTSGSCRCCSRAAARSRWGAASTGRSTRRVPSTASTSPRTRSASTGFRSPAPGTPPTTSKTTPARRRRCRRTSPAW